MKATNLARNASCLLLLAMGSFAAALPASAEVPLSRKPPATQGAGKADSFPDSWFWRNGAVGKSHVALTGKPAPKLALRDFRGTKETLAVLTDAKDGAITDLATGSEDTLRALRGKIVVVDFWATWCGPCRAALPKNVEIARDLGAKGVVVLGVHDSTRGLAQMDSVAQQAGINYPLAVDLGRASVEAWSVGFWPTYAVIDREGIVRAIGLQPPFVRRVVEAILAESPSAEDTAASAPPRSEATEQNAPKNGKKADAPKSDAPPPKSAAALGDSQLPEIYLEGDKKKRARLAAFDLCPEAPEFGELREWSKTEGLGDARTLAALRGKIVVLDFWATWCGPCIQSIPKNNEIAKMYADKGVVVIGICAQSGGEKMAETIRARSIEYPCAIDAKGELHSTYRIDGFPDYVIIDRAGRVCGADVQNGQVQNAIEFLLHQEKKAASSAP